MILFDDARFIYKRCQPTSNAHYGAPSRVEYACSRCLRGVLRRYGVVMQSARGLACRAAACLPATAWRVLPAHREGSRRWQAQQ